MVVGLRGQVCASVVAVVAAAYVALRAAARSDVVEHAAQNICADVLETPNGRGDGILVVALERTTSIAPPHWGARIAASATARNGGLSKITRSYIAAVSSSNRENCLV